MSCRVAGIRDTDKQYHIECNRRSLFKHINLALLKLRLSGTKLTVARSSKIAVRALEVGRGKAAVMSNKGQRRKIRLIASPVYQLSSTHFVDIAPPGGRTRQ